MTNIICVFAAAFLGAVVGNFSTALYCSKIIKKLPIPKEIINVWYED